MEQHNLYAERKKNHPPAMTRAKVSEGLLFFTFSLKGDYHMRVKAKEKKKKFLPLKRLEQKKIFFPYFLTEF